MKMRQIYGLLAFALILAPFNAQAFMGSSVFIEPSIGFRNESIKLTNLSLDESEMKAALPVYGLKLGYRSMIGVDLNLAVDYSKGDLEISSMTEKSDFTHQTTSVQLGVNALGLMKMYLGYAIANDFKVSESPNLKGFKLSGPAYIAGLQFKLLPFLNLGAQYNLNQFKKIEGEDFAGNDSIETYFSKIDTQDYSLNLSFSF
jgi:opacity protein-like surface antigen